MNHWNWLRYDEQFRETQDADMAKKDPDDKDLHLIDLLIFGAGLFSLVITLALAMWASGR